MANSWRHCPLTIRVSILVTGLASYQLLCLLTWYVSQLKFTDKDYSMHIIVCEYVHGVSTHLVNTQYVCAYLLCVTRYDIYIVYNKIWTMFILCITRFVLILRGDTPLNAIETYIMFYMILNFSCLNFRCVVTIFIYFQCNTLGYSNQTLIYH